MNVFLQTALLAIVLSSLASGLIGPFIVTKKVSSLSGSISHSILGGIGLFLFLQYNFHLKWADPIFGALLFALAAVFLIGWIHIKYRQKEDALIAAIWPSGMALGVIFVSLTPGYQGDFIHYLFGNVLLVDPKDLWILFSFDLFIFFSLFFFYKKFFLICLSEEMAKLQKIPVTFFYFYLLALISIAVVLLAQIMGIILVIALLSLPPIIVLLFSYKFTSVIFYSVLLSFIFSLSGLFIAYHIEMPPGPFIALIAALSYIVSLWVKKKIKNNHSLS